MSTISFPASLNDSFNGILNSSDSTNWAIYSYDKGGNDLKLAESGGKKMRKQLPNLQKLQSVYH